MTLRVNGTPASATPSGAAGGDLGGTYPNPTVGDLTITSEARGDLLRRGASAWGRFAAVTSGHVVYGDGTDVTSGAIAVPLAVDAAGNRTALGAASTGLSVVNLTDTSGWTDVSGGGGSYTITGGAFTAVIPSATTNWSGVGRRTWATSDCLEVRARVSISGDTTANSLAYFSVLYGTDGILLRARGDGDFAVLRTLGGYAVLGSIAARPVDGTGWLRMRIVGQRVTFWVGTGVGATEPTSWLVVYDGDVSTILLAGSPTHLQIAGQSEGVGLGAQTTVQWRSATVRDLILSST